MWPFLKNHQIVYSVITRQFVCVSVKVIVIWLFTEDRLTVRSVSRSVKIVLAGSVDEVSHRVRSYILRSEYDMLTYFTISPYSLSLHSWPGGFQVSMGTVSQE